MDQLVRGFETLGVRQVQHGLVFLPVHFVESPLGLADRDILNVVNSINMAVDLSPHADASLKPVALCGNHFIRRRWRRAALPKDQTGAADWADGSITGLGGPSWIFSCLGLRRSDGPFVILFTEKEESSQGGGGMGKCGSRRACRCSPRPMSSLPERRLLPRPW